MSECRQLRHTIFVTLILIPFVAAMPFLSSADETKHCELPAVSVREEQLAKWLDDLRGRDETALLESVLNLQLLGPHDGWAVPQLREAYRDEVSHVRFNAVFALRQMATVARLAAHELKDAVEDDDAPTVGSAVVALHRSGAWSQDKAVKALATIQRRELTDNQRAHIAEAQLAVKPSVETFHRLIKASRSEDPSAVDTATVALNKHRYHCIAVLVELLTQVDHHRDVEQILTEIGRCGSAARSADTAIIPLLRSSRSQTREAAADTLGRIGSATDTTEKFLIERLDDEEPNVRLRAAQSLSRLQRNPSELISYLKIQLASKVDTHRRAALVCILQLGNVGIPLLDDVRRLADGRSGTVREVLLDVYKAHGLPHCELFGMASMAECVDDFKIRLRSERDPGKLITIIESLLEVRDHATGAGPELIRLLSHEDQGVAQLAAYAVLETRAPLEESMQSPLIAAVNGEDATVYDFVIESLAMQGDQSRWIVPELIGCWHQSKGRKEFIPDVPATLVHIGDARGIAVIREGLQHDSWVIRHNTALALCQKRMDVRPFLEQLTLLARNDPTSIVRLQAARALLSIDPNLPIIKQTFCAAFSTIRVDREWGMYSFMVNATVIRQTGREAAFMRSSISRLLHKPVLAKWHRDAAATIAAIAPENDDSIVHLLERALLLHDDDPNNVGNPEYLVLEALGRLGSRASSAEHAVILLIESESTGVRRQAIKTRQLIRRELKEESISKRASGH